MAMAELAMNIYISAACASRNAVLWRQATRNSRFTNHGLLRERRHAGLRQHLSESGIIMQGVEG